jgi:hypothetical protein
MKYMVKTHILLIPIEPVNCLRKKVFKLITHKYFEVGSLILILVNVVMLLGEISNAGAMYKSVMWYANTTFVFIFLFESLLKIFGFGPTFYFKIRAN